MLLDKRIFHHPTGSVRPNDGNGFPKFR